MRCGLLGILVLVGCGQAVEPATPDAAVADVLTVGCHTDMDCLAYGSNGFPGICHYDRPGCDFAGTCQLYYGGEPGPTEFCGCDGTTFDTIMNNVDRPFRFWGECLDAGVGVLPEAGMCPWGTCVYGSDPNCRPPGGPGSGCCGCSRPGDECAERCP